MLNSKFGSFTVDQLTDIREWNVAEAINDCKGSPAAIKNGLEATIYYLRTDPNIGEAVQAVIAECPYSSAKMGGAGGANKALLARNAELMATIAKLQADQK